MNRRLTNWIGLSAAALIAATAPLSPAQDRAPAPDPGPAPTAAPLTDSDRLFEGFAEAAKFVQKHRDRQALGIMDNLVKTLATSPWLDVALLKRAELNENLNRPAALDDYNLLVRRLENAPYFTAGGERTRLLQQALQHAVERGITRVRIGRIKDALQTYYALNLRYPESLAKLAILGYISPDDIKNANGEPIRYLPVHTQLVPTVTYHRFDILDVDREPFSVRSPKLEGTSRETDPPHKYVGLLYVPKRAEPVRVVENQMVDKFVIAAIAQRGALLCTELRVIVLPVAP